MSLVIDAQTLEVYLDGEEVPVTPAEFNILIVLASDPTRFRSRPAVQNFALGYPVDVETRTVDVHLMRLRKKLGNGFIESKRGQGWRLTSDESHVSIVGKVGAQSPSDEQEQAIFEAWQDALWEMFCLVKAGRLGELKGNRISSFDGLGLHPVSVAWGRVAACQTLMPELAYAGANVRVMRREAYLAAEQEFIEAVQATGREVFG
jgi:DNA-binding winged helix-turn-helix (wHTH) protein